MKPSICKIAILSFLVSLNIVSQTKETILKKSFNADKNTILILDLDNTAIVLEESLDDKIYFDYTILFGKYSKKAREKVLSQVKVNVTSIKNRINLKVINSMYLELNHVEYVRADSLLLDLKDFLKYQKKKVEKYKTKALILEEIQRSNGSNLDNYLNKKNNIDPSDKFLKKNKVIIQKFVIKIPKKVRIRLKSINSNVTFKYNLVAPFSLNSFKGNYKFKKILSENNKIIASNGIFQAEEVTNASIEFLDMSKVVIVEISNTELATETSKIEFGEVGKNVATKDFNSKIYSYNFSDNFGKFSFKGEYSKLFLYDIKKSDFSMDVFGHNTALNFKDIKTTFGISKNKKLDKILEKKVGNGKVSKGNITIELTNGILNIK